MELKPDCAKDHAAPADMLHLSQLLEVKTFPRVLHCNFASCMFERKTQAYWSDGMGLT